MPDLTFNALQHLYQVDGRPLPSVTQILRRVNLCPASDDEFALSRGRAVHTACAQWEQGTLDDLALDPRLRGYLTAWQRFCTETAWESTAIERPLYSTELGIAGTPDRLGLNGTVPMGLDLKCGVPAPWHIWQLAGYSYLAAHAQRLSLLGPWMNVYLAPTGTYRAVVYALAQLHTARTVFAAAALVVSQQEATS